MKGNKKSFQKFISSKKKTVENVGLLVNRADLMEKDTEKAEEINAYLTSLLSRAVIRNSRNVWNM